MLPLNSRAVDKRFQSRERDSLIWKIYFLSAASTKYGSFQSRERDSLIWKSYALGVAVEKLNGFNPANGIH